MHICQSCVLIYKPKPIRRHTIPEAKEAVRNMQVKRIEMEIHTDPKSMDGNPNMMLLHVSSAEDFAEYRGNLLDAKCPSSVISLLSL